MKIGDLVKFDGPSGFCDGVVKAYPGMIISEPRTASDQDLITLGVFYGEVYEVVDVLVPHGKILCILEDMELLSESR